MNKKMREIFARMEQKRLMAKGFMEDGENKDLAKAEALLNEVDELQKEFDLEKRLYEAEKEKNTPDDDEIEKKNKENKEKDSTKEFAEAARRGFKSEKGFNETNPEDGGYAVPEDILTRIEKYRESKRSLKDLVTVATTKTNKGSRTFKKRSQQTGFVKVGENGKISAKATPKFERVSYEIEKYAGYFPVTNEVLYDSDNNLVEVLIEWIGDESRVTSNKLIIEEINLKAKTKFEDLDDIKKAITVTIGSAFKDTSLIVTNDDGALYLDTLKDADGKYILQPNPTDPTKMRLCAGATILDIEVYPNEDLPSSINEGVKQIPMIIGDLKEGIIFWDRQQMNIKQSDVASIGELNAFEEDLTLFRAIEREDVTKKDDKAFINGYIEIKKA
ncbi:phage major capsid protein [Faecalimicrobium sp. JNUCC 81]